jgi:DNA (cytosine-5)-methyltransferase 1
MCVMNTRTTTGERRAMMPITVGSLFSGVGGFDLGFVRAGFDVRWQCEIDRDCRDVLCRQFPETDVIYSDVRTLPTHDVERVDILIGGFPCQDLSVAGRRAGLDGSRSGLFYEFCRIIGELRPTLVVMENVAGLLSSNGGYDMAIILGTLRDLGAHDIAWCVLDAQWFGVPQRRRRVFLVADFAGERAAQILSLSEGLRGHPPLRRQTGQDIAGALEASIRRDRGDHTMPLVAASLTSGSHPNSNRPGRHSEDDVNLVASPVLSDGKRGYTPDSLNFVTHAVTAHAAKGGDPTTDNYLVTHSLTADGADASEDGTGRGTPIIAVRTAQTSSNGWGVNEEETAYTLDGTQGQAVAYGIRGTLAGRSAEKGGPGGTGVLRGVQW